MLRNGSDFGDDCNKIMIAIPAWNDMIVEVVCNTSSCNGTKVATDVKTIGRQMLFQYDYGLLDEKHNAPIFLFRQSSQTINMPFGGNQEMTVGIGKSVEQNDALKAAVKKEIVF
jgi:hypothetical protein